MWGGGIGRGQGQADACIQPLSPAKSKHGKVNLCAAAPGWLRHGESPSAAPDLLLIHAAVSSGVGRPAWFGTVIAVHRFFLPTPTPGQQGIPGRCGGAAGGTGREQELDGGTCAPPPLSLAEPGKLSSCFLQLQ